MTGVVVWFTGLPASGKTTLATAVQEKLRGLSIPACLLDSDLIRRALVPNVGYGLAERDAFYTTLARIAAILSGQGLVVLVAATAHRAQHRERARQLAPHFIEVYVRTPIKECRGRDPKGLYAQSQSGEITDFPGVQVEYEAPASPDVVAPGGLSNKAVAEIIQQVESTVSVRPDA